MIELCDFDKCTQCYACVNICPKECISMVRSNEGFTIPQIDRDACIECGTCAISCHRITSDIVYQNPVKTLACWTKVTHDRENSSSGGAFSIIAKRVLSEGGVVYGASMCEDLKVRHKGIEKESDLLQIQGSKYVQSYLGVTFKDVKKNLNKGRKVLFSGTPCQVAGLLTFLRKPYDNLITCDVVCHGVPSQESFDTYIDKIGIRNKCKNFNFRFTKGWGFQLSRQLVAPKDGASKKILLTPKKSYYLRAFTKGLMFSEACYSCAYARPERVSDITLADYWGLGTKMPFNHPTNKGVSLMLVNNEKTWNYVQRCPNLFFEERPFREAVEGNHNLSQTSVRPQGRDTYFEDSRTMSNISLCKKYGITPSVRDYLRLLKQQINSMR